MRLAGRLFVVGGVFLPRCLHSTERFTPEVQEKKLISKTKFCYDGRSGWNEEKKTCEFPTVEGQRDGRGSRRKRSSVTRAWNFFPLASGVGLLIVIKYVKNLIPPKSV